MLALGCGLGSDPEANQATVLPVPEPIPGINYEIKRLPPEQLELTGAAKSLDDLLRTIERAIGERDTTRLFDLMVTEREYRQILFPAFPAAHPPINADFASIWVNHFSDAYRGLHQVERQYGGKDVRIENVAFEAPDQDFVNFVLHETSRVDVVIDGQRHERMRLFGSVFRVGDQWKVLSYPEL